MKKKKVNYLLAFLIPSIVMILIYACVGIYPFGKKSLLTVDLAGQYVAFFNSLKNIFTGDINIYYSFSKTLGGNMYGLITYYLLSPFNLIFIFFDKLNITEAIFLINVLKIGFCGLTSYVYFDKTYKEKGLTSIIFSCVYALCAYNIVYSQNLLWLDGVILLPLVFLGIDNLIKKQKPILFYITLTLTIFCNYYIGYMVCIGSLVYFLYKLYLNNDYSLDIRKNKKDILYFFKYVLLSVGSVMVILLPSLFSLMAGKAGIDLTEYIPKQTYPVIELISRFFIGSFSNSDLSAGCPNIFISLFMILLAFIYFFNKKINTKEKKGSLFLILFFIASFIFYPIDVVWHLFQHPAGFPFRYSFIFDFIVLIIAYKSYINIDDVDSNLLKKIIPCVIILITIIDYLMYNNSIYYKIIGSGVLLISYVLYLYYCKNRKINKILALIIIAEMSINGLLVVSNMKYQNRVEYTDFVASYGEVIDHIKEIDDGFYRIEKPYSYSTNDQLLLNYNGISHFSSIYEGSNNSLLGDYLGIFNRFYITNYNGSTLVTNSIFNIKYILNNKAMPYYESINSFTFRDSNVSVYKNDYVLPIGFMVNDNTLKLQLEELKPFQNQNEILKVMTDNNVDVFLENNIISTKINNLKLKINSKDPYVYNKVIDNERASLKYRIRVINNGILYAYMSSDYNKKVDILVDGESIIDTSDQNNYRYNILDLGDHKVGDIIDFEVVLLDNQIKFNGIEFYTLDIDKFINKIDILKDHNYLNIKEYNGNYIKTTVDVDSNNKLLYTSIPFDEGWSIKVDGKKVDSIKIFDTLIGIELEEGSHIIEFEYTPRGLCAGGIISLVSIILVVILRKKK